MEPVDPEETIDGAAPRAEPADPVPVRVLAVVRDYPELLEVERRHYVVVRELARGGMGRVLEARDLRLGRRVAIKELLPKNRDIARRFEREARITARLQHPSIIHVYEAGVWQGGEPFYAMPVVPGRSLDKLVAEKTTLAERLALLPRVIAVADALAYAHSNNVIHRDLKPANVLVGDFGETVVIDWGLAKDLGAQTDPKESMALAVRASGEETVSGSVVGTPAYMPPEQARGETELVDHRADVYAIGALLYKVLAGVAPYQGETALEVIAQVKAGPPVPLAEREPDAPPDLLAIVRKAMARTPDDRYVTASELAQDLKRFETGQLVGAHRYTAGQLVRRWLRRHRIAVGVALAAAAALAIVGVISVRNVVEARDRAEVRRVALLEERGRGELLDGNAGQALAYLIGAAHDGQSGGVRGFLIAEAMRPFLAEVAEPTHRGSSVVVAASPDGKHIATAAAGKIDLWTSGGIHERMLGDHLGNHAGAAVIAFDLTSTRIAFGNEDGTVVVWNTNGLRVGTLNARAAVQDLAFSIDGRVAIVSADGVARFWNPATGIAITARCSPVDSGLPSGALLTVRFDPLGLLVAAGGEGRVGCVWQAFSGELITPLRGHTGSIHALRWSPDGAWIATASDDGTARVWSPVYGKMIVEPMQHGHPVVSLEVSSDGAMVATGDAEGGMRLWNVPPRLPTGDDGSTVPARGGAKLARHTDGIVALAFSADDSLVATAGADRLLNVWETQTGQPVATFEHASSLTSVAFAGRDLVTGTRDGTSRVWDPDRVAARAHVLETPVHAVAVSSKGVVAIGRQDSNVELLEPEEKFLGTHNDAVYAAAFTPDGATLVTAGQDDQVFVWDVTGKTKPALLPGAARPIRVLVSSPDGEHVATAGQTVQLWSLKTHTGHALDTRGAKILALAYAPSGDLLVGGAGDGQLLVWDAKGHVVAQAKLPTAVSALAFAPSGRGVAIAGVASAGIYGVALHTIDTRPRTTIQGAPGEVRAVAFACGGACLVTGSESGTADIWDAANGRLLGIRDPHAGAITGFALNPDGAKLWISTAGGTVGAWDVNVDTHSADWLQRFITEHVPWLLGTDDVVIRREGDLNEQRGSDSK